MLKTLATTTVAAAALLLAACAQTAPSGSGQDARARAEAACQNFVRQEGLEPRGFDGSETAGADVVVRVRANDKMGRRLTTSCRFDTASGRASWAQPLPTGTLLR
jgi:predicted small secreted protein